MAKQTFRITTLMSWIKERQANATHPVRVFQQKRITGQSLQDQLSAEKNRILNF